MAVTRAAHDVVEMNVPWFESPFFEDELPTAQLGDEEREQIQFFAENGYLVWEPEIPEFDQLAATIIERLRPEHASQGYRVQDAWRFEPAVKRLATHPEVLRTLGQLYRRRPIPFQTLNFQRGTEQRTHSDLIHFNSLPHGFMAGVWFALEDVGPDNGPLHYYPGSHKLRVYELHDLGLSGSTVSNRDEQYMRYEDFLQALLAESGLRKETVTMKRGQALIWAANLLHGGDPIGDPQSTRYSQVTHHYFEGCRYYAPLYSDPFLGRYSWREIVDISTGARVPHVYNGREVRLPAQTRARYFVEGKLRESELGRRVFERAKTALKR
jgi:hypothetical protein